MDEQKGSPLSRRRFLQGAASSLLAFNVVPRHVLGGTGYTPPSQRPNIAGVGIGGVGHPFLRECAEQGNIVALCDVDDLHGKKSYDLWPDAKRYRDYREMLADDPDIDAVLIATPDHSHAIITLEALKHGKHVCTVKPLTRTVYESRLLAAAAARAGTATQMTQSPNATEEGCRICELIWAGALGQVREVHIWTGRPWWPQGLGRPAGEDPVPDHLDWDLWIGPAPMRPFKANWPESVPAKEMLAWPHASNLLYHPFNFRGWWQFGCGALGDMGCHYFNIPMRALKLDHPSAVHASATRFTDEMAPLASIVSWDFPDREGMDPVRILWYDGGLRPPRPAELEGDGPLPEEGILYVGDEGKMFGRAILNEKRAQQFDDTPRTLERRPGVFGEWFEAMAGGPPATGDFSWSGPLTEVVLLGNIAIRRGKKLEWDGGQMRFTNDDDANQLLHEAYRDGWELEWE